VRSSCVYVACAVLCAASLVAGAVPAPEGTESPACVTDECHADLKSRGSSRPARQRHLQPCHAPNPRAPYTLVRKERSCAPSAIRTSPSRRTCMIR